MENTMRSFTREDFMVELLKIVDRLTPSELQELKLRSEILLVGHKVRGRDRYKDFDYVEI